MLTQSLVVTRKEVVDNLRDVRSVISSVLYSLMGPLVVGLVAMANRADVEPGPGGSPLVGMISVFVLVAAFVGGMNVAMDTIAGERERRSLLPLLLNPVSRLDIALGKWLAIGCFSTGGLILNLAGFAFVLANRIHTSGNWPRLLPALALGIFPLPLLAASVQLLISTISGAVKEAQTYLSITVFLPMGLGMFFVFLFFPAARTWRGFLPLAGQQWQLESLMQGREIQLLQPLVLGCLTMTLAVLVLLFTANRLQRDEAYGN